MLHAKTKDWGGMVVSNFLLLGIEADPLPNDSRFGTGGAPDSEGHFEADGEDSLAGFASPVAESMSIYVQQRRREVVRLSILAGKLIGRYGSLMFGWDITSHI